MNITANIYDANTGKSYRVHSEADCRDATDLSAYREAAKSLEVITMGSVIVQPIALEK